MRGTAALRQTAKELAAVTPDAWFEAKELVGAVLELPESVWRREDPVLSAPQEQRLRQLLDRRLTGYPLQYLLGNWEFYGLPFRVGPGVLIPRADTETLVEAGLRFLRGKERAKVLDLCSGTGCVAMALEKAAPQAAIFALEKEDAAFAYLLENRALLQSGVTPVQDDALCPRFAEGDFDLILANPPYLSEEDRKTLQREVSFEPETALFDGGDGLLFYRELTRIWAPRLKVGGMLAYEIGIHQEGPVTAILEAQGFSEVEAFPDLAGIVRVICWKKKREQMFDFSCLPAGNMLY